MSNDPADFTIRISRTRAFFQRDAKRIIRIEGIRHFKKSFQDEGFTDAVLEKWPDITPARKKEKRRGNGSLPPILTDTGDLGNSITGEETSQGVTFSSDKVYAQRHNEGLAGMPKRQFMGPSQQLEQTIMRKLDKGIGRIWNGI
jgi:phage gpG-like protein